jgi:hypothetical protein
VPHDGAPLYLAFQFDPAVNPYPASLSFYAPPQDWEAWDIATWFVRPNGLLNRNRPVDFLTSDAREALKAAAKQTQPRARAPMTYSRTHVPPHQRVSEP